MNVTCIYIVESKICYAVSSERLVNMSDSNTKYTVIREYNNLYGLEELVRRIIRHHIKDTPIETVSQGCLNHKEKHYEKEFNG